MIPVGNVAIRLENVLYRHLSVEVDLPAMYVTVGTTRQGQEDVTLGGTGRGWETGMLYLVYCAFFPLSCHRSAKRAMRVGLPCVAVGHPFEFVFVDCTLCGLLLTGLWSVLSHLSCWTSQLIVRLPLSLTLTLSKPLDEACECAVVRGRAPRGEEHKVYIYATCVTGLRG